MLLHDPEHKNIYTSGGRTLANIFVTGVVTIDGAEISVLDSDVGSVETKKK